MKKPTLERTDVPEKGEGLLQSLACIRQGTGALTEEVAEEVEAELARLREMAALGGATQAVGGQRSFEQVLGELARDAAQVAGCGPAWVVTASEGGQASATYNGAGQHLSPSALPAAAQALYARVCQEMPSEPLIEAGDRKGTQRWDLMALPIITERHFLGVLIFGCHDPGSEEGKRQVELLRSMLRHTSMAYENARLIEAMGQMLVEVVIALAMAIESRDPYTGGHVQRVTAYALLLAEKLGMDAASLTTIRLGGLLHDIGKVALPDAILRKPGKLTTEEYEVIKAHPVVGHEIVSQIPQLRPVCDLVRHHHERIDGKGYPDGLAGERIPKLARLLAIADTFDAMTSDRPYRNGMSYEQAMAEIERCRGTQFDSDMAEVFLKTDEHDLARATVAMHSWCKVRDRPKGVQLAEIMDLRLSKVA